MHLAHSKLKPTHWCQYCECPLLPDEVAVTELPAEQGCAGAKTLYRDSCIACGRDVEAYKFQDNRDE